jgi:hypothetical protein
MIEKDRAKQHVVGSRRCAASVFELTLYLAVLMSFGTKPSAWRPPSSGIVRLVSATAPFLSCGNRVGRSEDARHVLDLLNLCGADLPRPA